MVDGLLWYTWLSNAAASSVDRDTAAQAVELAAARAAAEAAPSALQVTSWPCRASAAAECC